MSGPTQKLTDKSPMPYGKYGPKSDDPRTMGNVPAFYLLYMEEQGMLTDQVKDYVDENRDWLEDEIK